jgi:hypothetical protein
MKYIRAVSVSAFRVLVGAVRIGLTMNYDKGWSTIHGKYALINCTRIVLHMHDKRSSDTNINDIAENTKKCIENNIGNLA